MGARCYYCGEKFERCYEHAGDKCPTGCNFGKHDCPGDWEGCSNPSGDLVWSVKMTPVTDDDDIAW